MVFGDPAPGREEHERGPYSSARPVLVAKQAEGPSSQADLRRAQGVNGIATDFMHTTASARITVHNRRHRGSECRARAIRLTRSLATFDP